MTVRLPEGASQIPDYLADVVRHVEGRARNSVTAYFGSGTNCGVYVQRCLKKEGLDDDSLFVVDGEVFGGGNAQRTIRVIDISKVSLTEDGGHRLSTKVEPSVLTLYL
ncbi:MAG TPA: hypothetical protein VMR16_01785 [Candidatus Saccharimonadales bacterium]|nr:hypothetical protein [Candidatus Saccharimonadales bacterium]